jgi:hypothetical protein
MNTNQILSILILGLSLSAAFINCYKIYVKKVEPTLSMWLIFCAATSLSLASYFSTPNKEFFAAALNGADVLTDIVIIITTVLFAESKWRLKPFEKYYLVGVLLIVAFWLFTNDAFRANLLIQVILASAYIPTYHNIIKSKRNSESFVVWGLILLSTTISLFPTFHSWQEKGNVLAFIYSVRSFVFISFLMLLMFFYHVKEKKYTLDRLG